MKKIKFHPKHTNNILLGKKTNTWRLFDDKDLSVGDELALEDSTNGRIFAKAKITSVAERTLDTIQDEDYEGNSEYDSRDEMFKSFEKMYKRKVNGKTAVKVIKFVLMKE
jgi:hypothetical protein